MMAMRPSDHDIKINDSLYQLYAPPGDEEPSIDIIFFHGLQINAPLLGSTHEAAYRNSWMTTSSPAECWPQQWLGPDLLHEIQKNARIFSVSYDSSALQTSTSGRVDFYLISENMVQDIVYSRTRIGQRCPVLLVGHSLGGLVLKKFVLAAESKMHQLQDDPRSAAKLQNVKTFLSSVQGIFYYSTPHNGAKLERLMRYWPGEKSPVVDYLKLLSTESARLNNEFREWRRRAEVTAWTMFELNETSFFGFHSLVVEEGSARYDSDECTSAAADHISICKPASKLDRQYYWLIQFIDEILSLQ